MASFLQKLTSMFSKQQPQPSETKYEVKPSKEEVEAFKEEQLKKSRMLTKQIENISKLKNVASIPGTNIVYEKLDRIGKGGFGVVYKVRFPNYEQLGLNETPYALKVIEKKPNITYEEHVSKNMNEKYIADRIQSEAGCLKEFLCYYFPEDDIIVDTKDNIYFISELMDGDLFDLLKTLAKFRNDRIDFVNQHLYPVVTKGLLDLHEMGLVHSDIKLENILYKDSPPNDIIVKIGDLGSACTLNFDEFTTKVTDPKCQKCKICLNRFVGTLPYVPPNQFIKYIYTINMKSKQKHNWSKQSDWYAFAIVIAFFLEGDITIDPNFLKNILVNASQNKISLQYLVEQYNQYIKSNLEKILDKKDEWISKGLNPEIYNFLETTFKKYI